MSSSTAKTTVDRQQLHRQIHRILNTNSLHFITIALLFVPFNFSSSAAVKFYFSFSSGDVTTNFEPFNLLLLKTVTASSQNLLTVKTLITVLAVAFFVILPAVAGIALITYSTYQTIYRRPLSFSSTFKSLSHSYIPLLSTVIAGSVTLILIFLLFTLSPIAVVEAIKALGFHCDLTLFLIFINTLVSYALPLTIFFFIVIWGSAAAIAVLESKSGFEALRQSANQSAEFRSHSFSILFLTTFVIGPSLVYIDVAQSLGLTRNWISVFLVVVNLQSSLVILHYVVANTVLYVQSKVSRGEEIAKTTVEGELSGEYVKVVVNGEDDDVAHELANKGKEATGGFSYVLYFLSIVLIILMVFPLWKVNV